MARAEGSAAAPGRRCFLEPIPGKSCEKTSKVFRSQALCPPEPGCLFRLRGADLDPVTAPDLFAGPGAAPSWRAAEASLRRLCPPPPGPPITPEARRTPLGTTLAPGASVSVIQRRDNSGLSFAEKVEAPAR